MNFLVSCTSELFLNILSKKPHLVFSETQLIPANILFFYVRRYISGAWPAYRLVGPGLNNFWFDHSRLVVNYALLG